MFAGHVLLWTSTETWLWLNKNARRQAVGCLGGLAQTGDPTLERSAGVGLCGELPFRR